MQVARDFKHDGRLIRKRPRPPYVLLRNARSIKPVEHSKHAQQPAVRAQQRDGQYLLHLIFADDIEVRPGHPVRLIGPEDFFIAQRFGGDSFRENVIDALWLSALDAIADAELIIFQQRDKAPSKAEKISGASDECL